MGYAEIYRIEEDFECQVCGRSATKKNIVYEIQEFEGHYWVCAICFRVWLRKGFDAFLEAN